MPSQPNSNLYSQSAGMTGASVIFPHLDVRPPSANDTHWQIGQRWIDTVGLDSYTLVGQSSIGGVLISNWNAGGAALATNTIPGVVYLGTLAQLQAGNAPSASYVPSTNDVFTYI